MYTLYELIHYSFEGYLMSKLINSCLEQVYDGFVQNF